MRVSGFAVFPSKVTTSGMATQLKRSRVRDVSSTLVGSKHLYAKPVKQVRLKIRLKMQFQANEIN